MPTFAQYTDGKPLSTAIYRCSSLGDQHLHLRKIRNLKQCFTTSGSKITRRSCRPKPKRFRVTLEPMAARIPKNSTRRQDGCANRLMLKPFKRNVFRLQMIERFVRGSDAAFCQITWTTCYK